MKTILCHKKPWIFLLAVAAGISPASGQGKTRISLGGGAAVVQSYGSDQDYKPNENDFPVTPSHAAASLGLSVARFFSRIGLELDVRYMMSSRLSLKDPSDGDQAEPDSLKRLVLTGHLIYEFSDGRFRPFLSIGAGLDAAVGAKDQTVTTENGFEAVFSAPKNKMEFVGRAGAGVLYFFSSNLGLRLDAGMMFNLKTDDHPLISTLVCQLGAVFGF